MQDKHAPASFRDPSGFIFEHDGTLFRQINEEYRDDYDHLMRSGLYETLAKNGLLIPHTEDTSTPMRSGNAYRLIRPRRIPFISYPYEWSFSQLKDAALTTLEIQKRSLPYGMILKDANAYNIQFPEGTPLLIDTLSFERYREGAPWIAYRQFVEQFLAPLSVMAYIDPRLGILSRAHTDGIPLDLASALLPFRSRLSPSLTIHLHMHAWFQRRHGDTAIHRLKSRGLSTVDPEGYLPPHPSGRGSARRGVKDPVGMPKNAMAALIDNLEGAIRRLRCRSQTKEWSGYYQTTAYSEEAMSEKERAVKTYLEQAGKGLVWDLGANTGRFSSIAAHMKNTVVALDNDHTCVDTFYRNLCSHKETAILPLVMDLADPSPMTGWAHEERLSLAARGPAHVAMALALIHHLAIGRNVPLDRIASYFSALCGYLIVEFVPKTDPQAARLFRSRGDIFTGYDREHFEASFAKHFLTIDRRKIAGTERILYFMQKR